MQPPRGPVPPAHPLPPLPAGRTTRGFGWLVLGGAVVWAALVVLVVIAFGSILWSAIMAMGEVKTPTPDGQEHVREAMAIGRATGIGALVMLLFSLVLDVITTVASIRRLDGRRGDQAVPIIALVSVTGALVLPATLIVLALLFSLVDLGQVSGLLVLLVTLLVLTVAPLVRIAQAVAGIVRLITGEPARPTACPGSGRL